MKIIGRRTVEANIAAELGTAAGSESGGTMDQLVVVLLLVLL